MTLRSRERASVGTFCIGASPRVSSPAKCTHIVLTHSRKLRVKGTQWECSGNNVIGHPYQFGGIINHTPCNAF